MSYALKQTRRFARAYRKLHDNVASGVTAAIETVAIEPTIGERSKGELANLLVYRFRSLNQPYLLGYIVDDDIRLVYIEADGRSL